LPSITGKDPGDVAKLVEREISAALKGMGPYKTCTNDLRAAKYEQAVKDAQVGLTAYPNSTLNRLCILTAYNQLKSPPDSIIAISEAILAKDPTSIIALNSAAEAYTAKGDKDKAIEYNLRIWRADPSNTTIATSIVNILATSGSPDKAIPIIDTLLAQNPGDPAMLDTKWKLLLNAKRWKEAIAAGEEVAKADTSKATLAFFQRQIGAAQNDSNTAKVQEIASRAAAKFPKDLDMQLLLTQSYRKSGQLQQALEHGRQAIDGEIAADVHGAALDPREIVLGVNGVEIESEDGLQHPAKGEDNAAYGNEIHDGFRKAASKNAVDQKADERKERYEPELHQDSVLVLHRIDIVDVQRAAILEYRQNDRQTHGRFGRRHHHYEEGQQVSIHLLPLIRKGDEAQVDCVEHQLNRHEDGNDIAPEEETGNTQREQDRAQRKEPGNRNFRHQSISLRARTMAPRIAMRISTEVISKGSR